MIVKWLTVENRKPIFHFETRQFYFINHNILDITLYPNHVFWLQPLLLRNGNSRDTKFVKKEKQKGKEKEKKKETCQKDS